MVTIVTPCKNPGPRLLRCIESVGAQTYGKIEHIVVDGASTDGSVELLSARDHIQWISEVDSGQTEAINKGLAMASGDLIGWLNADDVLTPQAITSVVNAVAKPEVGWSIGDVVVSTPNGATREKPAKVGKPFSWMTRNIAAQPGSFITRWALDVVGPLDRDLHYMMDLDLWLRLIDEGIQHAYIPEVLAVFEVHEDSKSGGISHAFFLVDDCAARLKSGRHEQAAFSLGRALAWSESSGGSDLHSLHDEIARLDPERSRLDERIAVNGLMVERAVIAAKVQKSRAVKFLDPRLWSRVEARARLWDLVSRAANQSRRRRAGAPYSIQAGGASLWSNGRLR